MGASAERAVPGPRHADIDTETFLLAAIALNRFPTALRNITRSVTGLGPTEEEFHRRYVLFLERFSRAKRP
jgi:hypothetical protein